MKRSEINALIDQAQDFFKKMHFQMPPFADWTPEEWATKDKEYQEIIDNQLGWDITDFGSGDFAKRGLFLFTIRNGNKSMPDKYVKPYGEKIMIVNENQETPFHFHWYKMEDMINRGGGNLMIQMYNSTEDEQLDMVNDVTIHSDGRAYKVPAGTTIRLEPGQSVTNYTGQYHRFYAEPGHGPAMIGEVSMTNDDNTDNRFLEEVGRFPEIEEDEPIKHMLVGDYKDLSQFK